MTTRTYAIGDVHGRADLLEPLLESIDRETPGADPRVIFLGDIIDRGPDSREAMDLVHMTLERWPSSVLVRGNHDFWFWEFMSGAQTDTARFSRWLFSCGGVATMQSYGLQGSKDLQEAAERFRAEHPSHLANLAAASPIVVDKEIAYVHAGIDPLRPLADQKPKDLMMIRQGFLDYEDVLPCLVVHGHTPTKTPDVQRYRIGIDTGAYATNLLTCLAVDADGGMELLQAIMTGSQVCVRRDCVDRYRAVREERRFA